MRVLSGCPPGQLNTWRPQAHLLPCQAAQHRLLRLRPVQHTCLAQSNSRQQQQTECLPQCGARWAAWATGALVAGAFLTVLLSPAEARVPTERFEQGPGAQLLSPSQQERGREGRSRGPSVREQAAEVLRLTEEAKQATGEGDYQRALDDYTRITAQFPDLAITNYARIGRALLLYQTGQASQALLELEALEGELRGTAEVHAALAGLVYAERPLARSYAEQQFDLATEFDSRYSDLGWVKQAKGWPPAALAALDKFVNLK